MPHRIQASVTPLQDDSSAFEHLAALAAQLLDAPMAFVTVMDQHSVWCRAAYGADRASASHEDSICAHAVAMGDGAVLVIEDAAADPIYAHKPGVMQDMGVRFYVGAVISRKGGGPDGVICVVDTKPRSRPSDKALETLKRLAALAAAQVDALDHLRVQRERLEVLRLAEDMSGVGHWRYELEPHHVYWSDEIYRIHGETRESFDPSAGGIMATYHPEDRPIFEGLLKRTIETGQDYEFKLRIRRPNGEERMTIERARAERDEAGKVVAIYGVFQDVTEQENLLQAALADEARYRLLARAQSEQLETLNLAEAMAGVGHWRWRIGETAVFWSDEVYRIHGLDSATFSPCLENAVGAYHPEDRVKLEAMIANAVARGEGYDFQLRILRADGEERIVEAQARCEMGPDGRPTCMFGVFQDVTEQVQTRLRIEQSEAQYRLLADNATDIIATYGLDAIFSYISPAIETALGYRPDELIGRCGHEFIHPEDIPAVQAAYQAYVAAGVGAASPRIPYRALKKTGEIIWMEAHPRLMRDESGRPTEFHDLIRDVTEQERLLQSSRRNEKRYRLLAENTGDVIARVRLDGSSKYISPAVQALLGWTLEDMSGQSMDYVHADDRTMFMQALQEAVLSGGLTKLRHRAVHRAGHSVWVDCSFNPIRAEDGQISEVVAAIRDASQTKRLEDDLIEARDRAEAGALAKSEFLANMSHELRTPLTSVIGFAGLLQSSTSLGELERLYADRIGTASEALLSVINDILDYSKLEAHAVEADPQPFDPRELAAAAATLIDGQRRLKGLDLTVEIDPAVPATLVGDEGRLRQVMLNLLSNAVKFTGQGEVRLEVSAVAAGEGLWTLRVAVSDTGIGVSPVKLAALFDRFTQADTSTTRTYGGTGLGLAISRGLIEMMGGEIGAEGRPAGGSTFWFEVPLPEVDMLAAAPAGPQVEAMRSSRILIADDAPANRELVTAILHSMGMTVETASNGAEAVEAVMRGGFDLVLMDVHMPVMDGLAATMMIRDMGGDIGSTPILALTANVQAEHVARCLAAGMDGHVAKPINVPVLAAAMGEWLGQARPWPQREALSA